MRWFEVIGEAARKISLETRQQHPEIPWQIMADFRNKLIHDYRHIKLDVVWDTIEKDLPVLKPQIEALLRKLDEQSGET